MIRMPLFVATVSFAAVACGDDTENPGGAGGTPGAQTSTNVTSTSQSASSTTGGATSCTPGEQRPCYTGPAGTQDVGSCRGGVETCAADGASFDACAGEILPVAETCGVAVDTDCDGMLADCTVSFQHDYRGAGPRFVEENDDGSFYVSGEFSGNINLGGSVLTAPGNSATFLLKTDAGGNHLWSKALRGNVSVGNQGHVSDADGNVFVFGSMQGSADFGGGPLTASGTTASYLAKFDATGAHVFSRLFDNDDLLTAGGIAIDALGDIVLVGSFRGTADFGGVPMDSPGTVAAYVVKLDGEGDFVWGTHAGGDGIQSVFDVALDGAGNVHIVGDHLGTIDFGDGPHTATDDQHDLFIAKLDPDGAFLWSWAGGGAETQRAMSVEVDSTGAVVVAGHYQDVIDVGMGTVLGGHLGLLELDSAGSVAWFAHFGDQQAQFTGGLALDAADNIVWIGSLRGDIDFGGGTLANAAGTEMFLAGFGPGGNHLWSRSFGTDGDQFGSNVTVDAQGRVVVVGAFDGTLDFGAGPLNAASDTGYFVALNPPL